MQNNLINSYLPTMEGDEDSGVRWVMAAMEQLQGIIV